MEALRERFGKYHVLEKLAQGGMAEVYKVKTVGIAGFEKVQALKRILPASAREGRFIRSFIDEARIAVELTHRNIVQVFDFGKADGELFLAMELIEGKDLRTAMSQATARDMTVPVPLGAYILSEVAAGLDYAHRKTDIYGGSMNIVHCDVSPSNVMLSMDGYVKILDFGIARATFASALERRRLRGKPRYMAPEQTYGEPPTPACDVFALGIIAWELFTGLPLFRGPNLRAILDAVRSTTPPRVDKMNTAVPKEIADAIATALSRDPADRGNVGDVMTACTRTAMLGSSRKLAEWLVELEQKPARQSLQWSPDTSGNTSMSVPKTAPPTRPSARSVTQSLANVPIPGGDLGQGTPGFAEIEEVPPRALPDPRLPAERPSFFDREPSTAVTPADIAKFGDRDPTSSTTGWGLESTTAGVPKLSDSLPDASFQNRDSTVPTEPARPSYEALHFAQNVSAQALRFDDEITHHGMAVPVEETSHDHLSLEHEAAAPLDMLGEEPIDDNLAELEVAAAMERRRTVIVSGMLAGVEPEQLRPIARMLGELAYQRGGVVIQQDDAELLVAFGLEVAGEDDVAIAMAWALDATAMVRDVRDSTGEVTLRVGARTGVATGTGERGTHIPPDAIEDARSLARDATAERPLFAGSGGRLTSSLYELHPRVISPRAPFSRTENEVNAPRRTGRRGRVLEVVGPRSAEARIRDREQLARRGAFVGRTAQLAELDAWFQRAIAADRRLVVLITGAAGTGKSRLVAEMIARRTTDPSARVRINAVTASPAHRLSPFSLVIDLYQSSLGLPPARGRGARQLLVQRLHHVLAGKLTAERARAVAIDVDRAMELRDGVSVGAPEIADLRPRVAAGLAAFRTVLADREKPMITIVEDIHLADSASLEVLRHTLVVPAMGPELLVLTTRPESSPAPASDVVLSVGDLVGSELRALITDRLGPAATPMNIAAVLARGGGNPLFIEELAQAVREAGEDIPASARDVVAARIDRLSVRAKSALRYAAVLGGQVRLRILDELVEHTPSMGGDSLGEGVAAEIDELVEAGFLARSGVDGAVEFPRGLVREVVYESLSARAQRESHARIGRLLASRFFAGREEPPAEIAEHLESGGEIAGAAAFWLRAGRLALTASDGPNAIACVTRTLRLERELGPTPPTATSRTRRRDALAGREEAHRLVGDLASDASDLDDLQRLCEGDPARLADVAIRRAQRMLRYGDYANAMVATVVAEDHGTAALDDRLRGESLRIRAEVLERLGRFDDALAIVSIASDMFHRIGATHDEMAAMIGRGRIHLMRAHYEQARAAYRPVMALIDKTGDPWLERIVTNHVAVIEMCLGNFTVAMSSAQRSLDLCRRYGDRSREGDALSVAGIILLEVGDYERAAAVFNEALDILSRTNSRWSRTDCLIYAGSCEIRRGNPDGLVLLAEALAEARRLGARYLEANALVARAAAHVRRGALTEAIEDATEGTAVARAATLVGYEIQGLARHALALARANRPIDAVLLADRALALLEHQKYLEGSEEEVLLACAEVLAGAGDPRTTEIRNRARATAQRKYDALIDPAWRAAYRAIPEIAALLG
ncbi:MAG: serine/threonine-protein kinase PknK [Kofleriaceae bacterium]